MLAIPSTPPAAGVYVHENVLNFRSWESAYQSAGAPSEPAARSPFFARLVWAKAWVGPQSHDAQRASATIAMNLRIGWFESDAVGVTDPSPSNQVSIYLRKT